jgi:hypothetical protein
LDAAFLGVLQTVLRLFERPLRVHGLRPFLSTSAAGQRGPGTLVEQNVGGWMSLAEAFGSAGPETGGQQRERDVVDPAGHDRLHAADD